MSELKSWAFENTESVDVAYQMRLRSVSSILEGATGAKDKEILCEQRAKSTSEPWRSQPLHRWQVQVEVKGGGVLVHTEEGWRGCQSTIPLLPCRQIQMSPTCPDCILHTFPQRLEDGCERVHKRGCAVVDKEIAVPSISSRPPPPLCAQCPKHHGDIETDISLLDERGISVTQAPKVNVVWVSKQLFVYCGMGERLKGTIIPVKAIKGNCSVHTSDKLFATVPGHEDICLFVIVCEALTKFAEVTAVSPHLLTATAPPQWASPMLPPYHSWFVHRIMHQINLVILNFYLPSLEVCVPRRRSAVFC